jgi:hypothetical protein
MPAIEKEQNAFHVGIVFAEEARESVSYRMRVVDDQAIGLPPLAAPADVPSAQLTEAWIGLQVFPESALQKQMLGVVCVLIRQCQLAVDD